MNIIALQIVFRQMIGQLTFRSFHFFAMCVISNATRKSGLNNV